MTDDSKLAILRVRGNTGHGVRRLTTGLQALDVIHREVTFLEELVWIAERNKGLARALLSEEIIASSVQSLQGQIIFHGASFQSPGFWEFLGKLNPLEVVREFLNDRHRRRQDREYREAAEKRRLELENDLLKNKVIRGRLQILRDAGLQVDDLLITRRVMPALMEIDLAVRDGLLGEAVLVPFADAEVDRGDAVMMGRERHSSVSLSRFKHLDTEPSDEE